MSWAEVKVIKDHIDEHIDYVSAMSDLKLFGDDSFVFNNEDIFNHLIYETPYAVNDKYYNTEILNYLVDNGMHIGNFIKNAYGILQIDWSKFPTVGSILENEESFSAVMSSSIAINLLLGSVTALEESKDFITNSQTIMDAIFSSNSTSTLVLNSSVLRTSIYNSAVAIESLFTHEQGTTILLNNYYSEVAGNQTLMYGLFDHKVSMLVLKNMTSTIFKAIKESTHYENAWKNSSLYRFINISGVYGTSYTGANNRTSKYINTKISQSFIIGYSHNADSSWSSGETYGWQGSDGTFFYSTYYYHTYYNKGNGWDYHRVNNQAFNEHHLFSNFIGTDGLKARIDNYGDRLWVVPYSLENWGDSSFAQLGEEKNGTVYVSYLDLT